MRAIVLEKFGGLDSLVYKEIPDPEAFSINHAEAPCSGRRRWVRQKGFMCRRRPLRDAETAEQRLRGFEVGGGEPLGEAGVDRAQEFTRRRGPSLLMP